MLLCQANFITELRLQRWRMLDSAGKETMLLAALADWLR